MKWKTTRQAHRWLMSWGGPGAIPTCPIANNAAKYLEKRGCLINGRYHAEKPREIRYVFEDPLGYSKQEIAVGACLNLLEEEDPILKQLERDCLKK